MWELRSQVGTCVTLLQEELRHLHHLVTEPYELPYEMENSVKEEVLWL